MPEYSIDPMDEFTACPLEHEVSSLMIEEISIYLGAVAFKDRVIRELLPTAKFYGQLVLEGLAKSGGALGIYRPPLD